jgi:hypothetical protein
MTTYTDPIPAERRAEAARLAALLTEHEIQADPLRDADAWDGVLVKLGLDDRHTHHDTCDDPDGCLHACLADAVARRCLHLSGDHALCDHAD